MKTINTKELAWEKMAGLIPAVIQNAEDGSVIMLGYTNEEALDLSQNSGQLTLFSRSRQALWYKGETSGNTMDIIPMAMDCDGDAILVQVNPSGPGCHLGFASCFQAEYATKLSFLAKLQATIHKRRVDPSPSSYTAQLFEAGLDRCAQKVGEEATETVIAAVSGNKEALISEAADLLFHLMVLLELCELDIYQIIQCLQRR